MTYGIPQQVLPVDLNGEVDLSNHHEWIRQRQNQEAQQQLYMMSASMTMANNSNNDQRQHDDNCDETQMNDEMRHPSTIVAAPVSSFDLDFNGSFGDIAEEDAPEFFAVSKPAVMPENSKTSAARSSAKAKLDPIKAKTTGSSKTQPGKKSNKKGRSLSDAGSCSPVAVAVPDHEDGKSIFVPDYMYSTYLRCISFINMPSSTVVAVSSTDGARQFEPLR